MRRSTIVAAAFGAFAIVVGVALAEDAVPTLFPADQQVPAPTPDHGQQVAVIVVALRADGEKVSGEILSAVVIDSFAPKEIARSAGEWQVRVIGEKEVKYLILNPLLDIEADAEKPEENDPYDQVTLDSFEWTLVVPLYDQATAFGATAVEVSDVASGNVIFKADLKRK